MRPRDSLDDQDPRDEAYDPTEDQSTWVDPREAGDDELKLKLDLQEDGLSREQILKYSVSQALIQGFRLQYPRRPHSGIPSRLISKLNLERYRPNLAPIIPILIEENPSALRCIELLAGEATRQLVLRKLFTVDNAMVLSYDARSKFDEFVWAVEALSSEKYVYRRIPAVPGPGPLYIKLQDGSEIKFGQAQNGKGPLPELCELRLAVTRVLSLSGAAGLMAALIEDPDVDTSRPFVETVRSGYYLQLACHLPPSN